MCRFLLHHHPLQRLKTLIDGAAIGMEAVGYCSPRLRLQSSQARVIVSQRQSNEARLLTARRLRESWGILYEWKPFFELIYEECTSLQPPEVPQMPTH